MYTVYRNFHYLTHAGICTWLIRWTVPFNMCECDLIHLPVFIEERFLTKCHWPSPHKNDNTQKYFRTRHGLSFQLLVYTSCSVAYFYPRALKGLIVTSLRLISAYWNCSLPFFWSERSSLLIPFDVMELQSWRARGRHSQVIPLAFILMTSLCVTQSCVGYIHNVLFWICPIHVKLAILYVILC